MKKEEFQRQVSIMSAKSQASIYEHSSKSIPLQFKPHETHHDNLRDIILSQASQSETSLEGRNKANLSSMSASEGEIENDSVISNRLSSPAPSISNISASTLLDTINKVSPN